MKIDKTLHLKGYLLRFYLYIGKMKTKPPEPEIDETYEALKRFEIVKWIRDKVIYLRALGIHTSYPFGCETFRDFLRELKKHKYKTAKLASHKN